MTAYRLAAAPCPISRSLDDPIPTDDALMITGSGQVFGILCDLFMLHALLLSADAEAVRILRRVMEDLKIGADAANGSDRALDLLNKRKFDAVVIDCDDTPGAPAVLRHLRTSASNKRAMAFAIINGKTTVRQAFDLGANFVIDKPLTVDRVQRSFRAAHGLMMRERRRYFRNALDSMAQITTSDGRPVRGTLINLSEGGMSLKLNGPVTLNSTVKLRFELPIPGGLVEAKAEVCWLGRDNLAGIRFLHIEQKMQRALEQWIAKKVDSQGPAPRSSPMFINATAKAR